MVKERRRLKSVPENSGTELKPRLAQATVKRERNKTNIIGTGTASSIQAVKTQMVSVFATKFDPSLDANTLSDYLKEKLGREVMC